MSKLHQIVNAYCLWSWRLYPAVAKYNMLFTCTSGFVDDVMFWHKA